MKVGFVGVIDRDDKRDSKATVASLLIHPFYIYHSEQPQYNREFC